jgi:hypothetical protein
MLAGCEQHRARERDLHCSLMGVNGWEGEAATAAEVAAMAEKEAAGLPARRSTTVQ